MALSDDRLDDLSREMVKGNKSVNWLASKIEAEVLEELREAHAEEEAELAAIRALEPVAWINQAGDYVELSSASTVYGSRTIPLVALPEQKK